MSLGERWQRLSAALREACGAAGRPPESVRLVAVSKLQPASAVAEALRLGLCDFGENYAQELRDKNAELLADPQAAGLLGSLRWHFIGPLQRNKVHLVAGRVHLIHSVDSPQLAHELAARIGRLRDKAPALTQDCLVQVNLAGETQKSGCAPEALPAILDAVSAAEGALRCTGLMCLPPQNDDPEASRPYFRQLRELAQKTKAQARPHVEMRELSMGMSHDFPVAISEGATLIRVGTALFGPRI